MVEIVPEGEHGSAKVDHFDVSEEDWSFTRLRGAFSFDRNAECPPGRYARLITKDGLQMTDTDHEQRSCSDIVRAAKGDVLIGGLGLGCILVPIFRAGGAKSVTVVESDPDVISLIKPHLRPHANGTRFEVVEADVFDWKPEKGQKFDAIWFDIWPTVCVDNLPSMAKLHQRGKYWKRTKDSFMDSWKRWELRQMRREDQRRVGWW